MERIELTAEYLDALDEIRLYARHCRTLVASIEYVLHDDMLARDGWKLHYAVDFSEVFNYVLPEETHESAPFPDGWASSDRLQQYATLSRFFGTGKIILSEPYAIELRAFYDRLLAGRVTSSLAEMAAAVTALHSALQSPLAARVKELAKVAELRPLTSEEANEVVSFFEQHAILFSVSARGGYLPAFERLRRLLLNSTFVALEELCGEIGPVDDAAVNRRFKLLRQRRGKINAASNYIDALSLEHLRIANRRLATRKERVLLVSRSAHLASVVEGESIDDGVLPFVRHPRIFSPSYLPSTGINPEFIRSLSVRRESLTVFIRNTTIALMQAGHDGVESDSAPESPSVPEQPGRIPAVTPSTSTKRTRRTTSLVDIRSMAEKIRVEWSSGEGLGASLASQGELSEDSFARPVAVDDMLDFLRSDRIVPFAKQRIREIFRDAQRSLSVLGAQLQPSASLQGSVLYGVELDSEELTAKIAQLAGQSAIQMADALTLFEIAAQRESSDYDLLLVLAVGLGAIGQWNIALSYASLAIQYAEIEGKPPHEARFFLAVCTRKALAAEGIPEAALETIRNAINSIDTAAEERSVHRGVDRDPRYLNERAVLRMWQIRFLAASGMDVVTDEATWRSDIMATLDGALDAATEGRLQLQILNTIAYLHLMKPFTADEAAKWLKALEQALQARYQSRSEWPGFMIDTVVFGQFLLRRETAERVVLTNWLHELHRVAERPDVTVPERDWVYSHINEINEVLAECPAPSRESGHPVP